MIGTLSDRFFGKALTLADAIAMRLGTALRTAQCRTRAEIGSSRFSYGGWIDNHRDRAAVRIGDSGFLRAWIFVFPQAGSVTIGEWVYIGPGTTIWSASQSGISIGDRVLISSDVHIHDTDGHPRDPQERIAQTMAILRNGHPKTVVNMAAKPIIIGDDVWIGHNASIMKGVTIGSAAIIGAGSVVTKDVLPGTVVAGNPARPIGLIDPDAETGFDGPAGRGLTN